MCITHILLTNNTQPRQQFLIVHQQQLDTVYVQRAHLTFYILFVYHEKIIQYFRLLTNRKPYS